MSNAPLFLYSGKELGFPVSEGFQLHTSFIHILCKDRKKKGKKKKTISVQHFMGACQLTYLLK